MIFKFGKQKLIRFWKLFWKNHKTSYLENYKDLSTHNWRRGSQPLRKLWYPSTTGLGILKIEKHKLVKFSEIFTKNHKKRHISKTTRIWVVIFGGKIRNPWEYPEITQLRGKAFQILKTKMTSNFLKKSQKNVISQKLQRFEQSFLERQDLQLLGTPWQHPIAG